MKTTKEEFIELMLESHVLKFGNFITKSGRETPYFINSGNYNSGAAIDKLCGFYAQCIMENIPEEITTIYGPAYKGIPLAVGTAAALYSQYGKNIHYSFNRKEMKDHGEGGTMVGYTPKDGDSIIIVEDVITAGLSIGESISQLNSIAKVHIKAIIISVDRMEKGAGEKSAVQDIEDKYGVPVYSIVNIQEVVDYIYHTKKHGREIINEEMKCEIEGRII